MEQRRILLLITDLEIGGTPTVVRELAIRLRPYAHTEVACLKRRGPVADQLSKAGVTVTAFDASHLWHLPRTIRRLRELIRGHRIDTVVSFLVHANYVAAAAAKRLPGVRFFQSIQTTQRRPRWHWWLQGRIWRHCQSLVVPSNAIVESGAWRSHIPRDRFVVIPNAIDPSEFPRVQVFALEPIRIGYLGRLDAHKNPQVLPRVLQCFGKQPPAELHLFGDGPMRRVLEQFARSPAFIGRIFLHGAVAQPQEALRQMDVLVLPSMSEGFGLVLIEAMASGVPVLAQAAGGVTDVVIHEFNGLLATDAHGASRMHAAGIHRLIDDVALRRRLIENGLKTVNERFTWERILPQYLRLLQVPTQTHAGMPAPP